MKRRNPPIIGLREKMPRLTDTNEEVQNLGMEIRTLRTDTKDLPLKEVVQYAVVLIEDITKRAINGEETYSDITGLYEIILPHIHCIKKSVGVTTVVQWLIKFGAPAIRESVIKTILQDVDCMVRSKHSVLCVQSMLECSEPHLKDEIIGTMLGNIVRLMNHPISSSVIDIAYTKFASQKMRIFMRQELYGTLFKKIKDELIDELKEAFKRFPYTQNEILESTRTTLKDVMSKKVAVGYSIFHCVLLDYLNECSQKDKTDLMNILALQSPLLFLNSRDGAYILLLLMESIDLKAKEKKLELIHSSIPQLAMSEEAYIFTIGLISAIKDPTLIRKYILPGLIENAGKIASNKYGCRIFLHLLAPSEHHCFENSNENRVIDILTQQKITNYGCSIEHSIISSVKDAVLFKITQDLTNWLSNEYIISVTELAMNNGSGHYLQHAFDVICDQVIRKTMTINKNHTVYIHEHQPINDMLMRLVQNDCQKGMTFAQNIISRLTIEKVQIMVQSDNGCRLLSALVKNAGEENSKILKSYLATINSKEQMVQNLS